MRWNPAARWWGKGADGVPLEVDVVAESVDRRHLLVGEAKWSDHADPAAVLAALAGKAARLPFRGGRPVRYVLWLKRNAEAEAGPDRAPVVGPEALM